jgi:hypothetical protein
MGAPVVHWEILARDAKRVQDFYSSLFDWDINANNPINYGLVMTGSKSGANGGIGPFDPNNPGPPVTFYVEVDDLQKYLAKAEGLGGRTVVPPTEIPNMVTFAMFADPEGNKIGLVKAVPPPPKKSVRKKKAASKRTTRGRKTRRRR